MPSDPAVESEIAAGLGGPVASRRALLAIVALGVAFDLTFNGQRPGLAVPLFFFLIAASLRSVVARTPANDLLLGAAVVLSIFPALRAGVELAALDVLASSALLGLTATQDVEALSTATVVGLTRRGIALSRRAIAVPRYLAGPLPTSDRGRWWVGLRLAVVAIPVLALFAALLASGDRVFARMLKSVLPDWNLGSIVGHLMLTLVGVGLVGVLWRAAAGNGEPTWERTGAGSRPELRVGEWMTVLAGIDVLFTAFVVVQFAYLFGGQHRVTVTSGLTYAAYARSGFFQLAAAAALTVVVIIAVWDAGRREDRGHERWFRGLVGVMVALTGVILASAVKRLALYEGTFGFTRNRFFAYVGIIAIGVLLAVLLTAIMADRRRHLVAGFLAVGLLALLVVNVLDPDRFVADRNVARYAATEKIDAAYLGWGLGLDAVPVAVDLLGRLTGPAAAELRHALCERAENLLPEPSWRSINLGRADARNALEKAHINRGACAGPGG